MLVKMADCYGRSHCQDCCSPQAEAMPAFWMFPGPRSTSCSGVRASP